MKIYQINILHTTVCCLFMHYSIMAQDGLNDIRQSEKGGNNRPNIVFILIDDMGWKDMGCSGSIYYDTPNLDQLAKDGVRFVNAYSSAPLCMPSRGAIFSGKCPGRTKFTTVHNGESAPDDRLEEISKLSGGSNQYYEALHRHALPSTEKTFADEFVEAGYKTAYFGKWHCGEVLGYRPDQRGFQVAKGYRLEHIGTREHHGKAFEGYIANLPNLKPDDFIADVLTDECISFITDNKDKPFLAFLSHYLVHGPLDPKPEKVAKYESRPSDDQNVAKYAAMIESVDESVGRIIETLKKLNIDKNTLVIFTSDNGGLVPHMTSNYPLMGGKSFPYEAAMKVPLLIKWPGKIQVGLTIKERTVGTDFYPTLLEAASIKLNPKQHADGISIMPLLLQNSSSLPKRNIIFHYPHYTHATGPFSSIISNHWKLIHFYNDEAGAYHLFNLAIDPTEQNDLTNSRPDKIEELITKLDKQLGDMKAEMPIKNPNFNPESNNLKNKEFSLKLALSERKILEERIKKAKNDNK